MHGIRGNNVQNLEVTHAEFPFFLVQNSDNPRYSWMKTEDKTQDGVVFLICTGFKFLKSSQYEMYPNIRQCIQPEPDSVTAAPLLCMVMMQMNLCILLWLHTVMHTTTIHASLNISKYLKIIWTSSDFTIFTF